MVEDLRTLIDRLLKNVTFGIYKHDPNLSGEPIDITSLRDLIVMVLEKAGDSKNALITTLGQEIGFALASLLKAPLSQLVEKKKLQITIELVSKPPQPEKEKTVESSKTSEKRKQTTPKTTTAKRRKTTTRKKTESK